MTATEPTQHTGPSGADSPVIFAPGLSGPIEHITAGQRDEIRAMCTAMECTGVLVGITGGQ